MTSGDGAPAVIGSRDVLAFWRAAGPDKWFEKDPAFDSEIAVKFFAVWHAALASEASGQRGNFSEVRAPDTRPEPGSSARTAAAGKLAQWEETPEGALALVIVLDQFPRNMFRGHARTYQADAVARAVADRAIARGFDSRVAHDERQFFYLPFMHSEHLPDQERCVALARGYGDDEFLKYAEQHADIVRRFGRFPHRNAMLGRATTPEEQAFLDDGGFAG
jgi:uncharacterized protein (DUF924 family)